MDIRYAGGPTAVHFTQGRDTLVKAFEGAGQRVHLLQPGERVTPAGPAWRDRPPKPTRSR
ncbi:hypothetical protein [Nonomuraea sp. LPB2021202275-12-8]|uniref:hypothetical protein n=1 Tax=Nonomuraea sp. LPB2021202275-12-8 TaxID=3120159 RepID=UPI00300CAE69